MLARTLAIAAVGLLALAGCTADAPPTTPMPTASTTPPSATILNPELVPQDSAVTTAESAQAETTRLADAIQALLDPATVLSVQDQSQLIPEQDDLLPYYAAYRLISLDPSVDPALLSETLSAVLVQSGWTRSETTGEVGHTVWALAGGSAEAPWFVFIDGDASVAGQSSLSFTIGSPDIVA